MCAGCIFNCWQGVFILQRFFWQITKSGSRARHGTQASGEKFYTMKETSDCWACCSLVEGNLTENIYMITIHIFNLHRLLSYNWSTAVVSWAAIIPRKWNYSCRTGMCIYILHKEEFSNISLNSNILSP